MQSTQPPHRYDGIAVEEYRVGVGLAQSQINTASKAQISFGMNHDGVRDGIEIFGHAIGGAVVNQDEAMAHRAVPQNGFDALPAVSELVERGDDNVDREAVHHPIRSPSAGRFHGAGQIMGMPPFENATRITIAPSPVAIFTKGRWAMTVPGGSAAGLASISARAIRMILPLNCVRAKGERQHARILRWISAAGRFQSISRSLPQLAVVGGQRLVLGHAVQAFPRDAIHHFVYTIGSEVAGFLIHGVRRVRIRNGERGLLHDCAGIDAGLHDVKRDTAFRVTGEHYGREGVGAAMAGQQRTVAIQAADSGQLEQRRLKDDAEPGHDQQIRLQCAQGGQFRFIHPIDPQHGNL